MTNELEDNIWNEALSAAMDAILYNNTIHNEDYCICNDERPYVCEESAYYRIKRLKR